jgi:hypothetical protein
MGLLCIGKGKPAIVSFRDGHRGGGLLPVLLTLLVSACGGERSLPDGFVRLDLEKANSHQLVRFYLGGFYRPVEADPFDTGLVVERDGSLLASTTGLQRLDPDAAVALIAAADGGVVGWDEFVGFVDATYNSARQPWASLEELRAESGYDSLSAEWFTVRVRGVMSVAERVVFIPTRSIREAVASYAANGNEVRYSPGTVIVAEHYLEGRFDEATVMSRRGDGFWDFFVYDAEGRLATATRPRPKSLQSPTQCVGCHLGSKLYEPERSFPAEAPPGPHGPRYIRGVRAPVSSDVVALFDEHRRRSDGVLGVYVTLYASELLDARRAGVLSPEEMEMLAKLGL